MSLFVDWGEITPVELKKDEIEALLDNVVKQVLQNENVKIEPEIDLSFVSPEEIHKLNREYRDVDRPTDVLSFPQFDFEGRPACEVLAEEDAEYKACNPDMDIILGDIVINYEQAVAQAKEYGHSLTREIAFLTAHSMLHLLGYDHMTPEEEKDMFARQEQALTELNITR